MHNQAQPTESKAVLKARRQARMRDRAILRHEVTALQAATTAADKTKAARNISTTVLKGTGLIPADEESCQTLTRLTAALLDNGDVGLFGIETAMKRTAEKLGIPASDIAKMAGPITARLDALV